ncbi:hypothetical protein SADUNF_Sadunf12G0111700 [Salix dunnii]|uniref:Uncharacterized protein n=1 Tax=Salix dunnii TaxID=1413687 RepID=A0A835JLQ2_9ROSI|nr:hypothetical protein SADUNF_Sadunf12G0111700 [Salix dunnii]
MGGVHSIRFYYRGNHRIVAEFREPLPLSLCRYIGNQYQHKMFIDCSSQAKTLKGLDRMFRGRVMEKSKKLVEMEIMVVVIEDAAYLHHKKGAG